MFPEVTKIEVSEATAQALVTVSNGDQHAFRLTADDLSTSVQEMLKDAKEGKLAMYLSFYEGDTEEEINSTLAEASDWKPVFQTA